MNVGELIKMLEEYAPDTPVHIAYQHPDHWRTMVAPEANVVDLARICPSQYHQKPRLTDWDNEDQPIVLIISAG